MGLDRATDAGDDNNNDNDLGADKLPSKCQSLRLRSIRKRMETERNKNLPKARKPRERPAPLSKYRRRTANARERQRMQEVNVAFERLKTTIPHHQLKQIDEKKDTKITTLRCAITYINALSELLDDVKTGKTVSPEYFFTDAQLGLEAPNPKKDFKAGKGRRKNDQGKKRKIKKHGAKAAAAKRLQRLEERCGSSNHALFLSRLDSPKGRCFNNRRKKVNLSAPFMIDNRPAKRSQKKKSNDTELDGDSNVLPELFVGSSQLPPSTVTIAKQSTTVSIAFPSRNVILKQEMPTSTEGARFLLDGPSTTTLTLTALTPIVASETNQHLLQANNSMLQNAEKSAPPAAVLALAHAMSLGGDNSEGSNVKSGSPIPFSTKGLQPISSAALQNLCVSSIHSSPSETFQSLNYPSPSLTPSPNSFSTSPTSTHGGSDSKSSVSSMDGQNLDSFTLDDISQLTFADFGQNTLMDYGNVSSIQDFLGDLEQPM